MDEIREHLARIQEIWESAVGVYQELSPGQQSDVQLLGLVLLLAGVCYVGYLHYGSNVVGGLPALAVRVPLIVLIGVVVIGARTTGRRWSVPAVIWRDWPRKPDPDAPRISENTVKPMKSPKQIESGQWAIFGEAHDKLYNIVQSGRSGTGKDEGTIGPAIYHELEHGCDDLVVLDPKAEQLSRCVTYGLIPPDADLYVYGTSPILRRTDAFDLTYCPRPKSILRITTEQDDSGGRHWQDSAAAAIMETGRALDSESAQVGTSLVEIAEVLTDSQALSELNEAHPRTMVSRNEREYGSVVAAANRGLEPLEHTRARSLFGAEGVRMPDFSSSRRQIIFLCPDPSASEESRLTAAIIEGLVQLASESEERRIQKFILNEAGSFVSLPKLPQYCDLGRGQGVYVWLVLQNYSQLEKRINAAAARSLWSAASSQMVGPGAEPALAEQMSRYTQWDRFRHRQPAQHYQSPGEEHIVEERRRELEDDDITSLTPGHYIFRAGAKTRRIYVPESAGQSAYLERHYKHRKEHENHGSEYL